jgi:hypothetical protein
MALQGFAFVRILYFPKPKDGFDEAEICTPMEVIEGG